MSDEAEPIPTGLPQGGTIGPLPLPAVRMHHATVIRDAVIHLNNEQPLMADLFELPGANDVGLRCTNLRSMNGKRPVFIDDIASIFYFPYLHIRFVEIPPKSVAGEDLPVPIPATVGAPADDTSEDELDGELEIDEDFLRRIREV